MKTIKISDKDYELLMELSKELQEQANHFQAFPYFWEPSSEKRVMNFHGEGDILQIFDHDACESFDLSNYAEYRESLWDDFLKENELEKQEYVESLESEWWDFLKENDDNIELYTMEWEDKQEHNPSLFLSDVKGFIQGNRHHLGKDPHSFARTIWRMPKMEALVKAIYRLNPQPKDKINKEAVRFVYE